MPTAYYLALRPVYQKAWPKSLRKFRDFFSELRGARILADFKAYGTRTLNRNYGRPASETWWTAKGSKRKLSTDRAVADAINYVLYKQPHPLVVWSRELGRLV